MQRENTLHSRIRGLTFVELIVTLAVFGMVTTVLLSSFLAIFAVREQTNVVQQANDDVRVVLDGIEREIQVGNNIIAAGENISFVVSARGDQQPYPVRYRKTAAGTIEKAVGKNVPGDPCAYNTTTMAFINVNSCWLPVTGSNVRIDVLSFSVVEAETGDAQTSPLVTVGLAGSVRDSAGNATPLTYSTSIVPRNRITVSDVSPSPNADAPITSFIDVRPAAPAGCRISNQYYLPIDPVPPPPGGWPDLYTDCDTVDLAFRVTLPGAAGFHSLRYTGPNAAVTFGSGETGAVDVSFTGPKALTVPLGTSSVTVVAEDLYGQTKTDAFRIERLTFTDPPPATQCSDGVDNADPEDTLVDMTDPGCSDPSDDDETNAAGGTCVLGPLENEVLEVCATNEVEGFFGAPPYPACAGGEGAVVPVASVPNGFCLVSIDAAVSGICYDRYNYRDCGVGPTPSPQCSDGIDNDGDGFIDYPNDPGCANASDDETNVACIPDGANVFTTHGCGASAALYETSPEVQCCSGFAVFDCPTNFATPVEDMTGVCGSTIPQCGDGADNDGDGLTDFPADPGCTSAIDNDETDSAPATPTGLVANPATCGTGRINVSWNAVGGATSYEISVDGGAYVSVGAATSYAHLGLVPNSVHSYSVRARNASGVSGGTVAVGATAPDTCPVAPTTPLGLAGSASPFCGAGMITISWGLVANATSYQLRDGATEIHSGPLNAYVHSGLADGSSHSYTVRATNAVGSSVYSGAVVVSAPPACAACDPKWHFDQSGISNQACISGDPLFGYWSNGTPGYCEAGYTPTGSTGTCNGFPVHECVPSACAAPSYDYPDHCASPSSTGGTTVWPAGTEANTGGISGTRCGPRFCCEGAAFNDPPPSTAGVSVCRDVNYALENCP